MSKQHVLKTLHRNWKITSKRLIVSISRILILSKDRILENHLKQERDLNSREVFKC